MADVPDSSPFAANNLLISHQDTRRNEMELEVIPSRFKRLKCPGK
jgi:hypothetical protein